jgi:hypothetical protein
VRWLALAPLAAVTVLVGCGLLATKYYQVTCSLPDTETNRAVISNRLALIAQQYALKELPGAPLGKDDYLAQYTSDAGSLSAYVERGRWQFAPEDITNFEALARRLKSPQPNDRVSEWLRGQLPPDALSGLSNYAGGPDPVLQKAVLRSVNDTLGGAITHPKEGIIYNPQRFAEVELSRQTQELLNRKEKLYCDVVELNERLLEDAYPQSIAKSFASNRIGILLVHHKWSGKQPTQYAQIESRLTNDLIKTFGDVVGIHSGHGRLK